MKLNDLKEIAKKYRSEIFEKFLQTKQGHPGSIFSIIEIVVALYYGGFVRFNKKERKEQQGMNTPEGSISKGWDNGGRAVPCRASK